MTKIMLVEDDKSLREIYGVRLVAEGYEIISAGDGEAALAMAVKEKPDLILSDVMMPKISGFDMLDILRATPETKDVKVIMMTALSSEDQRTRGETLGADRYLVKSQVGIEDVVRTVHDVLADAPVAAPTIQRFGNPPPIETTANNAPQPVSQAPVATNPPIVTPSAPVATEPNPTQPQQAKPNVTIPQEPTISTLAPTEQDSNIIETATPISVPNIETLESTVTPPPPVMPPQPTTQPSQPETVVNIPIEQTPAQVTPENTNPTVNPAEQTSNPSTTPPTINEETPTPSTAPMAPVQLPQPTAPLSSPAPASLGDRVINPITPTTPTMDIATMINQELNDGSTTDNNQIPPQF